LEVARLGDLAAETVGPGVEPLGAVGDPQHRAAAGWNTRRAAHRIARADPRHLRAVHGEHQGVVHRLLGGEAQYEAHLAVAVRGIAEGVATVEVHDVGAEPAQPLLTVLQMEVYPHPAPLQGHGDELGALHGAGSRAAVVGARLGDRLGPWLLPARGGWRL